MSLKEKIEVELNKVKQMNRTQKISYFKTYYMVPCIVVIVVIALAIWFIADTVFQKKNVSFGVVYNVNISDETETLLTDGYMERYGYDSKKCMTAISRDNLFDGTAQQMDAYSSQMALFAQIAAGEVHYLIVDKSMLDVMQTGGIFASVDEVLSDEMYKNVQDSVVILSDEDGKEYVGAIDLCKLKIVPDCDNGAYLCISVSTPDEQYPDRLVGLLLGK